MILSKSLTPNFEQALIDLGIDSDGIINQKILAEDAIGVTLLNIFDPVNNPYLTNVTGPISNLTGIEAFVDLEKLYLSNNNLSELDLSSNVKLTTLYTYANQLTDLNVTKNVLLTTVRCEDNLLTSIDVSQNTGLLHLTCYRNQLSGLDLQYNVALEYFYAIITSLRNLIYQINLI